MESERTTTRIARNTIALYIRSLITMLVSLYTSRLILQVLGIEDYGVYNAVGGVVVFFTVLDSAMSAAYERFLNYEMVKSTEKGVNEVFCTSINIQILLAIALFIITEIIGLFFLFNYLVIPEGRLVAAFWVFQCSVITLVVNVITIPFNALIIAKEKMTAFAYIDIINTFLKVAAVTFLFFVEWDKLILYGILIMFIQLGTCYIYQSYCKRNFRESKYKFFLEKQIAREMLGFSFWTAFSSVAYMVMMQGLAILYNIYYGVVASAAIGIGNQVMISVRKLVANVGISFTPQIVKRYSMGDYEKVSLLWDVGSKFGVCLFAVLAIPLILNIDYILGLWLVDVPLYAAGFTIILLMENLVRCLAGSACIIVRATGNIKKYELTINLIRLVTFVFILIAFAISTNVYVPYIVYFLHTFVEVVYNAYAGSHCINYSKQKFYLNNCLLVLITLLICIICPMIILNKALTPFELAGNIILTISFVIIIFTFVGFLPRERAFLYKEVSSLINRYHSKSN